MKRDTKHWVCIGLSVVLVGFSAIAIEALAMLALLGSLSPPAAVVLAAIAVCCAAGVPALMVADGVLDPPWRR